MIEDKIVDVAQRAARLAGAVLLDQLGAAEVRFKEETTQNLVTAADLAAETVILQQINAAFPDHEVLGEEGIAAGGLGAEQLWVVDPLDGTTNYAQGIPQFCTAVSYVLNGTRQVGAVFDPNRDEMFHAIRGEGAWMNGKPIHVSQRAHLNEAVVATGFYYDRGEMMRRTLASIESLFEQNIRGIRRLGSAALDQCWVACGRMEAFYEYQLSPWDYAASSLVVEEAGGRCCDREGSELRVESGHIIASNALLFDSMVDIVRW